jgi:hypothetical protein
MHQGKVAPHNHDFSYGPHCYLCGVTLGLPSNGAPDQIVVSDDRQFRVIGIAAMVVSLFVLGNSIRLLGQRAPGVDPHSAYYMLAFGFALLAAGLLAAFLQDSCIFDLRNRTVTVSQGFTFARRMKTYGFSECSLRLEFTVQASCVSQSSGLFLIVNTSETSIKSFQTFHGARAYCEELTRRTGITFEEHTYG